MAWLPHGEKILKISIFVLVQLTNVTDRQTDGRTPHADIYRAYAYASRGKNSQLTNSILDFNGFLRSQQHIWTIMWRLECNSFFCYFGQLQQRNHLKTSAVLQQFIYLSTSNITSDAIKTNTYMTITANAFHQLWNANNLLVLLVYLAYITVHLLSFSYFEN